MRNPFLFTALPVIFFSGTTLASAAKVTAPKAPTNLTVKAVGVNSFKLAWKDNANNEAGWEILVALKGGTPARYVVLPGANLTSYTLSTINNELPNKELLFQVRAYAGVSGKEKWSKKTSVVTARALPTTTFGTPSKLVAKVVNDGQIRLVWKDNSTSENGYVMEYKKGKAKKWESLGTAQPDMKFNIPSYGYLPATSYSFRVRAYKGNPSVLTDYSNIATAKTKKFQSPTKLSVKAEPDGAFSFKWNDNSSIEEGYELHRKVGSAAFAVQGTVGVNINSTTPVAGFNLAADYKFKLRGFRTVDSKRVYTGFSNTVSIKSTTLTKPSAVVATAIDDYSVKVDWKDETTRESGYRVKYRKAGTTDVFTEATAAANAKTLTIGKLIPGTNYEFQLSAYATDFFGQVTGSSSSVVIQSRTKDGIAGDLNPPIFYGTSFSYTVDVSRVSELTNLNITGLPAGLSYNSGTRTISGIVNEDGVKTISMTASFSNSPTVSRNLVLRVVRPPASPVTIGTFDAVTIPTGANQVVAVGGKFDDPDTKSAARVATTKGTFDIILYSLATPLTVDNFLDYVDDNRYTDSFFHRSINNPTDKLVMLQGGGYKYTSAAGFTKVNQYSAVANEPGVSNLKGTVAMAKLGSNANSATSEFFVNIDDVNAGNLDEQNEGFTAFGRVPDAGMDVVEAIHDLPTKAYTLTGLGSSAFTDVPMNVTPAPAVMEPDKLVKITGVTAAPILTYTVTSDNEAVATATVSGDNVTITGVAAGSANIEVKATDLDGSSITQDIPVTVN